ncbi:MAG TPA: hypothetical protein VGU46_06470 [Acidobacteriaceae bacterium]|nr:hypothetical protein [Acidobacteriaceae bacterium]
MKNALRCVRGLGLTVAAFSTFLAGSQQASAQKQNKHVPLSVVSDWTHSHLLFPESKDNAVTGRLQREIRWQHSWYAHHPDAWWPQHYGHFRRDLDKSKRDWSTTLGSATYEPTYDFDFTLGNQSGYGSLNTTDPGGGLFTASKGSLTVTGLSDAGVYALQPSGTTFGAVTSDNALFPFYPGTAPLDASGLIFHNASVNSVNLRETSGSAFAYSDSNSVTGTGSNFNLNLAPGSGQTYPAKFVFDVSASPSCSNDFVTMGIPSNAVSGGQANVVGVINLYTEPGGTGYCTGTGPTVKFAYASGSGEVPGSISISQFGTQLAYVENQLTGSSYFHVLTLGTTGANGSSPSAAAVPGTGNNAVDKRVLLSPDGGTTNQSSTSSPFVVYTPNDSTDYAYVTTYSTAGSGSGYLYKITNVFSSSNATPAIVWKVAISAIPSTPVYDAVSGLVFWTDNSGRIDYVADSAANTTAPTVVYGSVLAPGTTSENPVTVDSTNEMVYATFNTNGTNAIVVQAPATSLSSAVTIPVGTGNTTYGGPYEPDFNEAFYTGQGIPQMYVAGLGSGTTPTLYGINFTGGVLTNFNIQTSPLATGIADSSPLTEFYNPTLLKDYLFVGVTNHCVATTHGGTTGCVLALDITTGFPLINSNTTALAAAGGTTGIIVDNDSNVNQASSIYYATKTGSTLVKATQSGLK